MQQITAFFETCRCGKPLNAGQGLGDDKVASGFQVPVQNVVIVLSLVLENVLPVIKLFLVVVNALNHSLLLFLSFGELLLG